MSQDQRAKPIANYPHIRRAGDFLIISGHSARQADNSVIGCEQTPDGEKSYDIRRQTEAVLENIRKSLAAAGAGLDDLVELNGYLVDLASNLEGYNEIYNRYFDAESGPARTTVGVTALPHPDLLVEFKGLAYKPE